MTVAAPFEAPRASAAPGRWGYEGTGLAGVAPLEVAEYVAVALAVVALSTWVTPGQGGLDEGRLGWGVLSLVPALVLTRPWARVPGRELALALVLGASAFAVPFLTPTGWSGAKQFSTWVYGVATFLIARAFACTAARRTAAAGVVALLALDQFSRAWLPWWGGRDPGRAMIGTFYWHNQFAVYVLAGVAVGGALVVAGEGRLRRLGWVVGPLCLTGVILSTSRTTMAELVLVLGVLLVVALRIPGRGAALRWGALVAGSAGLLLLMTSGLAFPGGGGSPLGATARRSEAEALASNGAYRLDFWRTGVEVWAERPLTGSGFASFGAASGRHMAPGSVRSPQVHNGVVQGFSDGGIVHGLPVLGAVLAAAWALSRAGLRAGRRRAADAVPLGCALAGVALLAHGVVDFDWFFPSELAMTAWCLAGATGGPDQRVSDGIGRMAHRDPAGRRLSALLLAVLTGMAVMASDDVDTIAEGLRRAKFEAQTDRDSAARIVAAMRNPLRDPRPAAAFLDYTVSIGRGARLTVAPEEIERAMAATARLAEVDPAVAVQRQVARHQLGLERREALAELTRIVRDEIRVRPFLSIPLMRVLESTGGEPEARAIAVQVVRVQLAIGPSPLGPQVWEVVAELDRLPGATEAYRCAYAGATEAFGPPPERLAVRPPGSLSTASCDEVLRAAAGEGR